MSGRIWLGMVVVAVCVTLWLAGAAVAAVPGMSWSIHSFATPSEFSTEDNSACAENGCDAYQVTVANVGGAGGDGSPVTLTDTLPVGVTAHSVTLNWTGLPAELGGETLNLAELLCSGLTNPVVCTLPTAEFGLPPIAPDDRLELTIQVNVQTSSPQMLTDTATVAGGGAPQASTSVQNPVNTTAPSFGLSSFTAPILGLDGAPDAQAGDHPYEYRTRIDFNNVLRVPPDSWSGRQLHTSVRDLKDVDVDLPVGFTGSVLAAPQCTLAQLSSLQHCPTDTIVGHVRTEPELDSVNGPLYNMVPEHGVAGELGFYDTTRGTHVIDLDAVPTPTGYTLRASTTDIPQVALSDIELVVYGNPTARDGSGSSPLAQFTNPSVCTGEPLASALHMDSWQVPGSVNADGTPNLSDPAWVSGTAETPAVSECDQLRYEPQLSAQPDSATADGPAGLDFTLNVPQKEQPGQLATPPLRDAHVTLPAGLTVNPAAAGGLQACSEAQIGWHGESLFDFDASRPACPEASKIGSVEVETPALPGVLPGSIYLAAQNENPFHSLLAGYVTIDDPTTGVLVKIAGNLTPDPATGRITGVFDENPQFPFSALRLHFDGGPRGDLATPTGCGTYTTASDLMPWSAPDSGPDATPFSTFALQTECARGFTPGFVAGTTNPQAGAYAPFTLSIARQDGEQNLAGIAVQLPEGLLGKIAGIPLCPEANAQAGTCPEASRVGSVTAGAGAGPDPYFVTGSAYLTGAYNGGPYGLVEEVPAVAGPFNLGTVVVRQSLRIDPHTAQVTAVSDPLPTILDGIPLRVRRVEVTLDRPGFTFNPTSCTPMQVTGQVTSTEGATANLASRFQAGGCGELPFKPSFKVSTQAKSSKQNGASLTVTVASSQGQANIAKVAVSLPKQLPSRLTTIQQACPEGTFAANPASCPAGSNIGTATATTPVLANPVSGPAYLVSHGGAAFPNLVLILQGEGVTLELSGSIDIKKGVTSSAFDSVPDAPINTFVLSLPEGPHSALTTALPAKAKGDLCGSGLTMPTTITGQNGAVITQSTKIAVSGCPKAKAKVKPKRKHAKPRGSKRKKG
jgi:hypothetical protein